MCKHEYTYYIHIRKIKVEQNNCVVSKEVYIQATENGGEILVYTLDVQRYLGIISLF